jgi:hypothetical protein
MTVVLFLPSMGTNPCSRTTQNQFAEHLAAALVGIIAQSQSLRRTGSPSLFLRSLREFRLRISF